MNKVCVILGAGASYDVHNETVPILSDSLRPPLAKQLFGDRFWPWRQEYRGAELLGAELGRLANLQDAPFDLEEKLSEYASSDDQRVLQSFKHIPPYLRDVLIAVSAGYIPSPTNHLNLVRRLLVQRYEVAFVLLNYDTLLEDALSRFDPTLSFARIEDYVAPGRQARVFKVHGSVNWAIPMAFVRQNWWDSLREFDPSEPGREIVVADSSAATYNWRYRDQERHLYPRLTAPVREKTFSCPEAHTMALGEFLHGCNRFLVVGTSGLDDDLLEFLDAHVSPSTVNFVQYVDYGSAGTKVQERFQNTIRGFRAELSEVFSEGYTKYLDSDDLERLLSDRGMFDRVRGGAR